MSQVLLQIAGFESMVRSKSVSDFAFLEQSQPQVVHYMVALVLAMVPHRVASCQSCVIGKGRVLQTTALKPRCTLSLKGMRGVESQREERST